MSAKVECIDCVSCLHWMPWKQCRVDRAGPICKFYFGELDRFAPPPKPRRWTIAICCYCHHFRIRHSWCHHYHTRTVADCAGCPSFNKRKSRAWTTPEEIYAHLIAEGFGGSILEVIEHGAGGIAIRLHKNVSLETKQAIGKEITQ